MLKALPLIRTLCVVLLLALAACDNGPGGGAGDVEGVWAVAEGDSGTVFLRITADSIQTYVEDEIADCFDRIDYEIRDVQRRQFRIASDTDTFTITLRRDGDELVVTAFDVEQRYTQSTTELELLLLCEPANPGVSCTTPPPLGLDDTIFGTIDPTDPQNPDGSRYELFQIPTDTGLDVRIDMTSTEIDSYLVLYDSLGVLIEENDDVSNLSLNARIEPALEPGCYILMATTKDPGDFGEYVLWLSEP